MENKTALLEWGLNEREAECYLSVLRNGLSSANDVSKATGILRQTVYEIIDKLQQKGLISQIVRDNKNYFEAASPEKFKSILEEKEKIIDSVLPSLESLQKLAKSHSKAQVFVGVKGMRALITDPLSSKTEIKSIQPIFGEEYMKEYFIENFLRKRIEKKIPIKILREETKTGFQKHTIKTDMKEFREIKLLKELTGIKAHFFQYDNKLVIAVYNDNPIGIIIEDEWIAESFSMIYNILWKIAKH